MPEEILIYSCYKNTYHTLCLECYLKEFKVWLKNRYKKKFLRNRILLRLKKRFMKERLYNGKCFVCNKNKVNICFATFSSEGFITIQKEKSNQPEINLLLETYNYSPYLHN